MKAKINKQPKVIDKQCNEYQDTDRIVVMIKTLKISKKTTKKTSRVCMLSALEEYSDMAGVFNI